MQEFIMRYPRWRNPMKMYKPHYAVGYNWTTHALFPQTYLPMFVGHHHHYYGHDFGHHMFRHGVGHALGHAMGHALFGHHHHHW